MDVEELRKRLVPYNKQGFKDLVALRLSPVEFRSLRDNVTSGMWLEWMKAAMILGDPKIQAVVDGVCIMTECAKYEYGLSVIAKYLEE